MEKYELVKDIGSGNFGVARLMRNRETKELVAMKYIERGHKVVLTPTHLAIVMEYAAGGELFQRICNAGRFSEDEARYFFQQLISGVGYCHTMQICHRDLKLENTLLDGSPAPRLKICDFGYSKRITIKEIRSHPWFLKNLPRELTEAAQAIYYRKDNPTFSVQSNEEILKIVEEAKVPAPVSHSIGGFDWGGGEDGDAKEEEVEEEEDENEKRVKEAHARGEIKLT
ncbi:hypothetical protein SLEP1_g31207 [Rubroshorea leprosula]|uniref:non-specific serine/threonine protein kinase n=1 Tax=Rubroshorea leprosula TaxID=152421 RepID=A0AAV5K846_9ROSI|nr:hypothetical protein SLEP1_g31207 [Rubroshorea leprosula]